MRRPWYRRYLPGWIVTGGGGSGSGQAPLAGYVAPQHIDTNITPGQNHLFINAFFLPVAVTFSKLSIYCQTGDASANSDWGLYNNSGALIANVGPTATSSFNAVTANALQGSQTIQAGTWWFAVTTSGTTLSVDADNTHLWPYSNTSFGTSSGGTLPNSISIPAFSVARNNAAVFTLT